MGFVVLVAMKTSELVFWVETPCERESSYGRLVGTYCLIFAEDGGVWRQYVPLKH